jgi:hypothetical protein
VLVYVTQIGKVWQKLNGVGATYLVFYGFEKVVDRGISWDGKLHDVQPDIDYLLHGTGRPGHRHKGASICHRVSKVHIWIIGLLLKQEETTSQPKVDRNRNVRTYKKLLASGCFATAKAETW